MAVAERKPKAKGKVVDRPYLTIEDKREQVWKEKWPNMRFCLVHTLNFRTGQPDPMPVWEKEARDYTVLSEDQSIVRHAGHVLMGIDEDLFNERENHRLERVNRKPAKEVTSEKAGDGVAETTTTVDNVGKIGDFLG